MRLLAGSSDRRKEVRRPAPPAEPRESPDSELVAASSRSEFASHLASFYYATPATRSRQPDRRAAFRRANASIAVAMRVFVDHHFACEGAIDVNEVSRGQNDSEDPPGQTDFQTIISGFSCCHRQGINRIPRGQHYRVHAEHDTRQHARHGKQGKNEPQRPGRKIFLYLRLNAERKGSHYCRERRHAPPRSPRQSSCARIDFAAGFHLHPKPAVHHEREQGQYSHQDGVPVEDAGFVSEPEIGPQRLEEIPTRIQRHTAHYVTERRAEKHRKQ